MLKRFFFPLAACALLSVPALAADLTGTWTTSGERHGARAGAPEHNADNDAAYIQDVDVVWTLNITEMKGNGFHGEWCSPNKCEDLVGVVSATGAIYAADEDGHFMITRLGDRMELCYLEAGETFRIAGCLMLERD
jgi:hypothetical protein